MNIDKDISTLFLQMLKINEHDVNSFIIKNSLLLFKPKWPIIEEQIKRMDKKNLKHTTRYYNLLKQFYQSLSQDQSSSAFMKMPLGHIWMALIEGEINLEYALELAKNPKVANQLFPLCMEFGIQGAIELTFTGEWRKAVKLFKLLLAAVDGRKYRFFQLDFRKSAVKCWITIVYHALMDVPDGRLLKDASDRAKQLISDLTETENKKYLGHLYHDLASLHLDIYGNGKTCENFESEYNVWLAKLVDEFGRFTLSTLGEAIKVPEPKESFAIASNYFRKAIEIRQGNEEALSFLGLAESLIWSECVGIEIDKEEIRSLVDKAMKILTPESFPKEYASLINIMRIVRRKYDVSPN